MEHSISNSEDADQTPHYAVSDLDLHCLPVSHKRTLGSRGLFRSEQARMLRNYIGNIVEILIIFNSLS